MAASDFRRRPRTGGQQPGRFRGMAGQHHDESQRDHLRDAALQNALDTVPVLLPQSEVAERALIGSALIDEDVLEQCAFVKPGYFFREENGRVWGTLLALHARGVSVDPITVAEAFQDSRTLDEVGGVEAILAYGNGVPHSGHAKDYARIICEKYIARYSLSANRMLTRAGERGDTQEIASAWNASHAEMQEVFTALGIGTNGKETRFRLKTLAEMRNNPLPEWIIPGILQERKRSLIFGDSNTGKSFLAIDMALSLATGLPWHGRPVKQGRVVYVCAEGADDIIVRVDAWIEQHGLRDAPDFRLVDDSPNLLETGDVLGIINEIKNTLDDPPALVIFDTLTASMPGGDQDKQLDMGIVTDAMHRIQRECGCGVMLVHHTGKDPTKGPRGSSTLRADLDIALHVQADDETGLISLRGDKVRYGDKRTINLGFRLIERTLARDPHLTSCILEATNEPPLPNPRQARSKPTASDRLYALMQETGEPQLHGQWCTAFIKAGFGQRTSFHRALQDLFDRRLIECVNGLYQLCVVDSPI